MYGGGVLRDCVLAIDQGTTGSRAVVFDAAAHVIGGAYRELPQIYPRPGWVEHDPNEIWRTVRACVREAVRDCAGRIAAVGITNQRETTVCWHRERGEAVGNAIVWQCRRTADLCGRLADRADAIQRKSGLRPDPYFSGTKMRWMLENRDGIDRDACTFGTVDAWLIRCLTQSSAPVTDMTNASRTLLFNITERCWDAELCEWVGVPAEMLPEVRTSQADFGVVQAIPELKGVPILGVAGDQQAALFGQCGVRSGNAKNTYGTGCFVLQNTGDRAVLSEKGLLTTIAVDASGGPCYALEGAVFVAGAALQWLRDELQIVDHARDSERMAESLPDNQGVYFVPAFVGLGTPHWDPEARGVLVGLTRGTGRREIVRAALESMAYQTSDVLASMSEESGLPIAELAVDGGAAENDFLLQFQADILDIPVVRPANTESTALGAAFLAGLGAGIWADAGELARQRSIERRFVPGMSADRRRNFLKGWRTALRQAMVHE